MKHIFTLILLSFMTFFTGVYAQISTAKWQSQPLSIDGDGSDWGVLPRFFNTDSNIKYEFRNDAENLYFILKAGDKVTEMQLKMAGFSVKFKVKTSGEKFEINFKPNKTSELPQTIDNEATGQKLVDKSIIKSETILNDTAMLDGFKFTKGILSAQKKNEGIFFAKNKNPRDLTTYEMRVPLRELFGNNYKIETIATVPLQLQFIINDLTQDKVRMMSGRAGSRMGGRMGGGSRNEMGGGMPGGGEMGEMPGSEMQGNEMQGGIRGQLSFERKGFNKDFQLSNGK